MASVSNWIWFEPETGVNHPDCANAGVPERAIDVWMGHVGHRSTGALYYQLSDQESQNQMKKIPF